MQSIRYVKVYEQQDGANFGVVRYASEKKIVFKPDAMPKTVQEWLKRDEVYSDVFETADVKTIIYRAG